MVCSEIEGSHNKKVKGAASTESLGCACPILKFTGRLCRRVERDRFLYSLYCPFYATSLSSMDHHSETQLRGSLTHAAHDMKQAFPAFLPALVACAKQSPLQLLELPLEIKLHIFSYFYEPTALCITHDWPPALFPISSGSRERLNNIMATSRYRRVLPVCRQFYKLIAPSHGVMFCRYTCLTKLRHLCLKAKLAELHPFKIHCPFGSAPPQTSVQ